MITVVLNQAFLNIYGYKNIDETRNIKLIDHYTPESYAEYMQRHERRLNGAPHQDTIEVDIIRKDGAIRHLQLSSTKLFWDGKEQALTIFNDVTERKQAEQLYNTLSESSPGGVYIAQNEKFVFTNTVFQKILAILRMSWQPLALKLWFTRKTGILSDRVPCKCLKGNAINLMCSGLSLKVVK